MRGRRVWYEGSSWRMIPPSTGLVVREHMYVWYKLAMACMYWIGIRMGVGNLNPQWWVDWVVWFTGFELFLGDFYPLFFITMESGLSHHLELVACLSVDTSIFRYSPPFWAAWQKWYPTFEWNIVIGSLYDQWQVYCCIWWHSDPCTCML